MPNHAVDVLISLQSEDGGYGAYPGRESRTESTALAALALGRSDEPGAVEPAAAALEWIASTQLAHGPWSLAPGFDEPHWSTSLAVMAMTAGANTGAADNGARWLIAEEGQGSVWWVRALLRLFPQRKSVDLDPDLIGWPWASGTFSWVEPTSYAILALKRLRGAVTYPRLAARVEEGDRLLVDRACVGGGWNYGNSRVFDEDLWPYPDTTAVALLALGDREDLPQVGEGLDALPGMLAENDSILALALGALALGAHDRDAAEWRERLASKLESWDGGEIRALAWAALALDAGHDVLEAPHG
jgi:hypothetical protein